MKNSDVLPLIGFTMGDPVGVGPEIIIKAFTASRLFEECRPVVFGVPEILTREAIKLESPLIIETAVHPAESDCRPGLLTVIEVSQLPPDAVLYGKPNVQTGRAMAAAIRAAAECAKAKSIDAIVTAPISKKSLHDAGYNYPGHTEMLANLTGAEEFVMMLAGERLKVVLVTIHCALSRVPSLITTQNILRTIKITHDSLLRYFSLARPRIAVAALNPHAGESGMFGSEEQQVILPAVQTAQSLGIHATGPHPPDTIFYAAAKGSYDAVVCMYHDQGLIPLKLLHFDDGVNITLGLPIIRTSVDHGTAYDIAGKGIANPASLIQATRFAIRMAKSVNRLRDAS